jgi:hypothetical protein
MILRQRCYPKEEMARRGQELYESGIRQQVEAFKEWFYRIFPAKLQQQSAPRSESVNDWGNAPCKSQSTCYPI